MGFDPKDFALDGEGKASVRMRRSKLKQVPAPMMFEPASRVVAIDPSICKCGWAILDLSGDQPQRVASGTWSPCISAIDRWIQYFEFIESRATTRSGGGAAAQAAILEAPNKRGFHREKEFSRKSQITYGRAVGVAHAALLGTVPRVYIPDVEGWKGRDKKLLTMNLVSLRLGGYQPRDDNEADALGLGLWFWDHIRANTVR